MNQIECSNCGELNNLSETSCVSCGVKLSSTNSDSPNSLNENDSRNAAENSAQKNKKASKPNVSGMLDNVKLLYIVVLLTAVAAVILVSSGTFESPKAPAGDFSSGNMQGGQQGNPHSAEQMKAFQEIENLQKQFDANPTDMELLLKLSHLLNDNGMYEQAIERYELYLTNKPNIPDVLVDLGVCFYNIKDFDNAIDRMKKAIKIEPKHQIAHFNLGIVNFASENVEQAKEWWNKTVKIDATTSVGKKAQELLNTK